MVSRYEQLFAEFLKTRPGSPRLQKYLSKHKETSPWFPDWATLQFLSFIYTLDTIGFVAHVKKRQEQGVLLKCSWSQNLTEGRFDNHQ